MVVQRFDTWDELKAVFSELPPHIPAQYMTVVYAEYNGDKISYILSTGDKW